ncbi:DUF1515 family protein [Bradyrhizobium sp. DOA9]|uniref:DUF1515 family protein n=1 Tax=Bradyrhizobium sp. DOA9 TaxID=1126627 RepID=UPI00046AFFBE|nr:DUF1515 family protein [Bradyrhizobium sp. DOA9]GAJ35177.1 hypothetical protein BDOA9_0143760 [Bradyrhizobium sp. DOA9]
MSTGEETVNAALLRMAEKVGGLASAVETLTTQWRQQDEKASQGRRDLHQKMDALRLDVQKLDGEVKAAIADIALMKPTVEAVESAKLQAEGVVTAVRWSSRGLYWLAFGLTLGAGWVLSNWLNIKVSLRQ